MAHLKKNVLPSFFFFKDVQQILLITTNKKIDGRH